MKLGFSNLGCPGWTLEQTVAAARQDGYQGIELRLLDGKTITPAALRAHQDELRRLFGESGVELLALGSSVRLSATDPAERGPHEAEALDLIPIARDLGAPLIRIFGGKRPEGVSVEQGVENVASGLNRLASAAEDAGVTLVLETHDDFSSAKVVADVMSRVPSAAVGALWDLHHPYRMGESPELVWRLIGPRVRHVHVKDARRLPADQWALVLLGEGEVPVREAVALLRRVGYDGYLVVEWEKMWHSEIEEPEVAFPQHAKLLRSYLAE